ncbi:MAG: TldD/PmbA family protein, partial [Thermoplasmata archaeon]
GSREAESLVTDALEHFQSSARKQKVTQFDAYAVSKRSRRVFVERGRVSGADSTLSTGLHARVCVGHKVGGAFCNSFDRESISGCISEAVKVANLMEPDLKWAGFPSCDRRYPSVSGIYDKSVATLGVAVMRSMAEEMVDSAMSVSKDVSVPFGEVEAATRTLGITNSSGVDSMMTDTELRATLNCVAGTGLSISPDCEGVGRSRDCGLRVDAVGERAGWLAHKSVHLVKARTEEAEAVFSHRSIADTESGLLSVVLSKALSGQSVLRNVSFLADRVGDQVWPENVTLSDNPLLSGRCGSRPFDDEGIPSRRTRLVDKGVLKGYLWDGSCGSASGEGSTGNAVRDTVSGAVSPAPLCLQLAAGRGSLESLVESVDHGYLVWAGQGAHTSNTETGEFSFVASPAFLIEGGEVVGGVRGAMVSGNINDLMANVERVGADVVDFGGALMPSVLFKDVRITTG